jgi:ADP-ribose pyrophosphatase
VTAETNDAGGPVLDRPDPQGNNDAAGTEPAASHVPAMADTPASGTAALPAPHALDERVIASETLQRGRYIEYRNVTIERPDGSQGTRDIVWHPGAVAMVALDEDRRILLVRQYRVAAEATLLELPAGTLDVDAGTGGIEDPDAAAARELEEETGYRAGRLERIADFWTAPGFATERMFLYLATDLRPADADRLGPDEDEHLELERLPWREAVTAVERGEIRDAKSIAGILLVARRLELEAG